MISSISVVVLLATLSACSGSDTSSPTTTTTPEPSSAYAQSWSAVHADAANTDWSPVDPGDDLSLRWDIRIQGSLQIGPLPWTINLGPTTDPDGNLYVTSTETGCHLRALEGSTGNTRWCAEGVDLFAVVSSPLIDRDGDLYVADGIGMHAFDVDGNERWMSPLSGVPLSTQFTPDGHLVFVTHTGTIYVLDRASGAEVIEPVDLAPELGWDPDQGMFACAQGTEACPSANTIAIDDDGVFYFTFWEPGAPLSGLRSMRYHGGDEPFVEHLWTNETLPGGSASSPVISGDGSRIYVTDNVDALHAVDADSGETIWSFTIGFMSGGSPSLSPDGLVMPAGGRGSPLIAVRDEGDRGVLAWRRDDLQNRGIATQTAGDRVYATIDIGDFQLELVVLDARDGTILDREELPGTNVFSVGTTVGNDGTVYVPSIVGGLFAFIAEDHER